MGCNAQSTACLTQVSYQQHTAEEEQNSGNLFAQYPEIQPYIIELFSKILPDTTSAKDVLERISQQRSSVSSELCEIIDPDNTGVIEVEEQQRILNAMGVQQTEVDLFRMTREEFKEDFAQYFE